MAAELCTTAMANVGSPRFSFSRDHIKQQYQDGEGEENGEEKRGRLDGSLLLSLGSPATSDFDFCVTGEGCDPETSTADELFSDGKILPLPIQIQQPRIWTNPTSKDPILVVPNPTRSACTFSSPPPSPPPPPLPAVKNEGKESVKVMLMEANGECERPTKTSFWKLARSTSLSGSHGGGSTASASIICSSVTLFTRSKSTGSHLNPNPCSNLTATQKQQQLRKTYSNMSRGRVSRTSFSPSISSSSLPSNSSSSSSYYYGSCHGRYGNIGLRISPVLNVPHTFIPKGSGITNGFFGFGHLLCRGREKEKNSRKKPPFSAPQPSS